LLTRNKVSKESAQRMQIITSTTNGFVIAEQDLAMRGPGDMYGTRQSGIMKFKLADLVQDVGILEQTRNEAKLLLEEDPKLLATQNHLLRLVLLKETQQAQFSKIS
jgi:ATP-dependent DNA helicase RecG